ncbi:mitochondrial import inner membrane translocase subunit tim54 [Diplodia corticola]|uniref:Mitochondrial import inner membrane translocase subunit TIM54 n=1 Tax=Diplodia corticola TaxID=236234 RepID=A0A1J9SGB0_9PEZI|nr:mitochondrial import inner membrane translocase subunit tim54 [Diplodia corticola]OJD38621.1 mitochondrial import inner membrane translocase subunit tim54 [Diplodia corticola]
MAASPPTTGMPNFRFKLPSRNWIIFLTVTGSWTAALWYDRRQKKRIQQDYCDAVAHLAREPLATNEMQRRMTVYLAGPPADGLMGAREHFIEYVKPILVAAAMDWEAVEGRREGDVRAQTAEKVRRLRKAGGEASAAPEEEDEDTESVVLNARARVGVKEWQGVQGDIVIGRNTWKEYVRGLHEGWLGPLDPPPPPSPSPLPPAAQDGIPPAALDDASPSAQQQQTPSSEEEQQQQQQQQQKQKPAAEEHQKTEEERQKEEEEEKKKKKRAQPPPYNSPTDYASAALSPNCPPQLAPSAPIPYPHILGFLNTPLRMWRFLNRRALADEIGAQVAAAVLAAHRPYGGAPPETEFAEERVAPVGEVDGDERWEQQRVLKGEEKEWHKSVRKEAAKKKEEEGKESVWCDELVVDPRIAGRMRRFVLSEAEKARVKRINNGVEGVLGQDKGDEE